MDNEKGVYTPRPHARPQPEPPKKGKTWFLSIVIGVIIGTVIGLTVVPFINDFLDKDASEEKPEEKQEETNTSNQPDESHKNLPSQMNVDVSTQVTEVVDQVSTSVVGVTNVQQSSDFWAQQENSEAGTGSGVIYKVEGDNAFVITNHHVIEGADAIDIVLADETTIDAKLLGSDIYTDLAVLQIDAKEVDQAIELGTSEDLRVGEPAIAIGNPLGHMFSGSVTVGVVSGTNRTIPVDISQDGRPDWQAEVIQTDAAINPGNSGGALINIEGHLIGINSMKINEASVEGIGFAIPIDAALPIVQELEETGEITRPYLGVEIYSLEDIPQIEWERSLELPSQVDAGVYIWSVEPLSPADKSGLKRLDVIVEIAGQEIENTIDLRKILYEQSEIGDEVSVVYYRQGKKDETTLTLGTQ